MQTKFLTIIIPILLIVLAGCKKEDGVILQVNIQQMTFDFEGNPSSEINLTISGNTDWIVFSDKDWCEPDIHKGSGDKKITLSVGKNALFSEREATITIMAVSSSLSRLVSIKQNGSSLDVAAQIPDDNFRAYCLANFDSNKDGKLSLVETETVQVIEVPNKNILSLEGIAYFGRLHSLNCSNIPTGWENEWTPIYENPNIIASLDLSENTELEELDCSALSIKANNLALNISQNTQLKKLICFSNRLWALDVSPFSELEYLDCHLASIASLDLSRNRKLKTVICGQNPNMATLDLTLCPDLMRLDCFANSLRDLNLSANKKLIDLNCGANHLSGIDLSLNTELKRLDLSVNLMSSVDLSYNLKLEELYCSGRFYELDISANRSLKVLDCPRAFWLTTIYVWDDFDFETPSNSIPSISIPEYGASFALKPKNV